MKNTKTNVIELVKKMHTKALALAQKYAQEGNQKWKEYYTGRNFAYIEVINLLTDEKYFNDMHDCY